MNIAKRIEQGSIIAKNNRRLDIGTDDIQTLAGEYLAEPTEKNLFFLIVNAYKMGLAAGTQNRTMEG